MKIKETKELDNLFELTGESDKETFADKLLTELFEWDVLLDSEDIYGNTISDSMQNFDDYPILERILGKFGINPDSRAMSDLLSLVLMDDYDCEECGGEMRLIDSHSECVGGDGWNTPYEYEVTEKWECPICGNVVIKNYIQ